MPKEEQPQEETHSRKFVYAKPYIQEKVIEEVKGKMVETTPKLDAPVFRDSYKRDEVSFEKKKLNGIVADVKFRENYNKDGFDLNVLMVTKLNYVLLQVSMQSVLGQQLAKRLQNIDLTKNVVFELWKNSSGYANFSVYQRDMSKKDDNGIHPKVFVADAFKDDENVPEVEEVVVGKQKVRDSSARVEYLKASVEAWKETATQLKENAALIDTGHGGDDDGNDDE